MIPGNRLMYISTVLNLAAFMLGDKRMLGCLTSSCRRGFLRLHTISRV